MNNIECLQFRPSRRPSLRNTALALTAGIVSLVSAAGIHAQATSGNIFGHAPAGETVLAHSSTGLHRHETVNAQGRYKFGSLPEGSYAISLEKDGKTVDTQNISVMASRGTEVDFACPGDQCAAAAK